MKKLLMTVVNTLNKIIKKDSQKVVFTGQPDFDDMLRGMLPYLHDYKKIIILLSSNNYKEPSWLPKNCTIYPKLSIMGLFSIITSSRIYYTHGLFQGFKTLNSTRQVVINLWHGMPLKRIGHYIEEQPQPQFHYTIATSGIYQKVMSNAFGVDIKKVLLTGLPRNNLLKNNNKVDLGLSGKIIFWLPTYQEKNEVDDFFGFQSFDIERLNDTLKLKNTTLIIKPHPYERIKIDNFTKLSNVMMIDENYFYMKKTSLYEVLGSVDELWTDYSSVFIDFIATNKKITFIRPNSRHYKNKRGLIPDVSSLELPGVVITSQNELHRYLEFNNPGNKQYHEIGKQFLAYDFYEHNIIEDAIKGAGCI
ncbi:hypothetical protein D5018_06930 [Parashewanella curva]|uniref:CDP-glycerol--glycerophosphate glycerophosphotransferase n=1 Tax=Parashewanella curva TaxID=2338552 RepID=A0A3L8PYM5_9GAMM|nr:CDP-glycerol glycerophosphotransferase family protein [Parashewanella curva]RLV60385.1 hypothetical protein D5018_06930 [Parashewanella curva]